MSKIQESLNYEESDLVKVYLRIKPSDKPSNLYQVRSDRCLITSLDKTTCGEGGNVGRGRRAQEYGPKIYSFSHIFGPDVEQIEVFERVAKNHLKKLPEGHSFTLFSYGASGSGKTFSFMGNVGSPGLVPRSLEYVFKIVEASTIPFYKPGFDGTIQKLGDAERENELQFVKEIPHANRWLRKYKRMSFHLENELTSSNLDLANRTKQYVWVSFVEIYNEMIYDLLKNVDRSANSQLTLREDASGNVFVKEAKYVFVTNSQEAYNVFVTGKRNLHVARTGPNKISSRSHCIFTITMLSETANGCRTANMRFCDLAGCDRNQCTENIGACMAINTSLRVLEKCLRKLRTNQRTRRNELVPFRESKLTRLLGAGLSGARGEAVSVFVTLNTAPECLQESLRVLELATITSNIRTCQAHCSTESTTTEGTVKNSEIMYLRAENERLKVELLQAQSQNRLMKEKLLRTEQQLKEANSTSQEYYGSLLNAQWEEIEKLKKKYEALFLNPPPEPSTSTCEGLRESLEPDFQET